MKKKFLLIAICLAQGAALAGATITVTSPAQSVTWAIGQTQAITWNKSGSMDDHVLIRLRNADGGITISNNTANDGEFAWTIPSSVPPGQYTVRVRTLDVEEEVFGDSGTFDIAPALPPPPPPPPSSLTILEPNGGSDQVFLLRSDRTIRWNWVMVSGKVRLELVTDTGQLQGIIADNLNASDGSHPWKAGRYGSDLYAPPGLYRVRVRSLSDPTVSDQSDQTFRLKRMAAGVFKMPYSLFKPDLVMCTETAVYVPLKTLGWFHIYVRNIGQGTAKAPFDVSIFLAGHDLFRVTIETDLGPGVTRFVRSIADSKISTYTIGLQVRADPGNVVAETDEDNNISTGVLYIAEGNQPSSGPITCGDGSTL